VFFSNLIGITACMLALLGGAAIGMVVLALTVTVHWSFAAGFLLMPVYLAAMMGAADWAADLQSGRCR
jgi:hypothetical protein